MANRTDTQSVINLVINGQQALTTQRELTDAQRRLTSELRNTARTDPGYQQQVRQLQMINTAVDEYRRELRGLENDSSKVKSMWKDISAGVVVGDLFNNALGAIKGFYDGADAAFAEAEKSQAQLAAVIESTGQAAGRTKDQLNEMAGALMEKTGIDDDVINKSQEMLLTFTNVRNEMFDQANPAIIDMTAAMNSGNVTMENVQKTSIQVGKALNDPIKGYTALKKVGVTFNEEQKKSIANFQQSGQMAKAQAIILNELKKEFGGVADAINMTDTGKLQLQATQLGNIQENIGKLSTKFKVAQAEAFQPFLDWMEDVTTIPVADTIREQQTELNTLVRGLILANDNEEVRSRLLSEISAKYPEFLGKLDKEVVSTADLVRRLDEANDQYRQKIQLAINEDKIKDKQKEYTNLLKDQARAYENVAKSTGLNATQLAKLNEQQIKALANKARDNAYFDDAKNTNSQFGTSGVTSTLSANNDLQLILNGRRDQKKLEYEINDLMGAGAVMQTKITTSRIADIDKEIAALKKRKGTEEEILRLQIEKSKLNGTFKAPPIAIDRDKKADDSAKKRKALDDKLKADIKKNAEEVYQNMLSKEDKEVEAVRNKYENLRKEASKNAIDKKSEAQALLQLSIDEGNEQATLIKKFNEESLKEAEKIAQEKGQKIAEQFLTDQELFYEGMTSEHQREIDAVNKKYDTLLSMAEAFGMDMMDLELKWAFEIDNIDKKKKGGKKKLTKEQELKEYKKAAIQTAETIADATFNIGATKRQAESDAKLSKLEKDRQAELDAAEGNEASKLEINARYAELEKQEKVRAWEENRKASITQALINGALAITNIWATAPVGPLGISTGILLGLSAISTAASIATIAAASPPEFATGVRDFKGGVAKVGEAGPELIKENDKWWLTNGETMADLAPGADVFNADDTSKMLANSLYKKVNYTLNSEGVRAAELNYRTNGSITGDHPSRISTSSESKSSDRSFNKLEGMISDLANVVYFESQKPVVNDYYSKQKFEKKMDYNFKSQSA